MKKMLCILLSLVFLLTFSACGTSGEEKEEQSNDEEQIRELIINRHKDILGIATKEEARIVYSEARWIAHSLDAYYDRLQAEADLGAAEDDIISKEEYVKEEVGDNYSFSVDIKELTFSDDKEKLAQWEERLESSYRYELDGIEEYCTVTCVVRLQGDKDVIEWEYTNDDATPRFELFKIDGKWCFY